MRETRHPMRFFAPSLCKPQGILFLLGPYWIYHFSPTIYNAKRILIQNKSPLGKVAFSLITLSLEAGDCFKKHAESIGNTFQIHSCKLAVFAPWSSCHLHSPQFSSVQFSCSVVSDSLRPHESQHARPRCPSPTPGVHSDSRPSSQWCHPAISSSVVPFSFCP